MSANRHLGRNCLAEGGLFQALRRGATSVVFLTGAAWSESAPRLGGLLAQGFQVTSTYSHPTQSGFFIIVQKGNVAYYCALTNLGNLGPQILASVPCAVIPSN